MDSSSHLEKMGRELKCPICLSLLDSAVSLTCNHVFCNECIQKSMKLASNCPVCKVPYRRREVRPAPHMDNLVNIYKSMEVASGANIFVSQSVPSKKISGGENQPEADEVAGKGQTCVKPVNQRKLKGKRPKEYSSTNSSSDTMRPSFLTNKRIQVPQHPLPETPMQPTRLETGFGKQSTIEPHRSAVVKEAESHLDKKENQDFRPFFWLQNEEDADKCTPHLVEDTVMDTPPDIPCFSDLKDADDELQCNMSPKNGTPVTSHNADLFDSEMFEWTQRACSPELFSSPTKMRVEETVRPNEMGEETIAEDMVKNMDNKPYNAEIANSQKCTNNIIAQTGALACSDVDHNGNNARATRHRKRIKKARKCNKKKRAKLMESEKVLESVAEDSSQTVNVNTVGNHVNMSHVEGKFNIRANKTCPSLSDTTTIPVNDSTLAKGVKSLNNNSSHMLVVDLFPSLHDKDDSSESKQNNQTKKAMRSCIAPKELAEHSTQNQNLDKVNKPINKSKSCKPKKTEKVLRDLGATKTLSENVCTSMEGIEAMHLADKGKSTADVFVPQNDKEGISRRQKSKSSAKQSSTTNTGNEKKFKRSKLPKMTPDSDATVYQIGTDLGSGGGKLACGSMMDSKTSEQLNGSKVNFVQADNPKVIVLNDCHAKESQSSGKPFGDSPKINTSLLGMSGILRKCEKRPNNVQCSFCHSVEDSEASGVMVHYLNGKPVKVGYNESGNVIHVHRNCAEWAPNVYFEDDVAVNLVAELTRSKRIKCGCCGLKGAALGCYEKSCRRSFHVPCAKLTPQCRWDNENFVMLCPLHASSKLPNEISEFRSERKEKSLPRKQLPISQPKSAIKQDNTTSCRWNSNGSSAKLVLCCSALTTAEKETVSEFEMLSGVKVLKNWDASVTHIITSTDENGACRRTLKFLMGILEGKWILNIEWVKACLKAKENVDEQRYEIDVDIHGIRGGPRQGRLRLLNKQPKLFDGHKFYFIGDFQPSYRGYLHDLIIAAGGTVLHRKPISGDNEAVSSTFIIYSLELPDKCNPSNRISVVNRRRTDAVNLASSCQAVVATNSWILNSVAACKLQNLAE